jgi:esterase/lipase superfamily enzyme
MSQEAVTYSRDSLAHVLNLVAEMRGVGEIGLVGHSMRAWLTVEALRQLRLSGKDRVIERLHHVALAAPDIDVNVFRSQMAIIGRLNPPMKLLVSKDDQALSISACLDLIKDIRQAVSDKPGNRMQHISQTIGRLTNEI